MDEIPGGDGDTRREQFRRRGRWVIAGLLIVLTAAELGRRALWPRDDSERYAQIIGEPYTDVFLFFGAPRHENDDGAGGVVAHYDEWRVIGGRFELKEFRIFVNADGRVYQFERD